MNKCKLEILRLHVGQESADSIIDIRAVLIYRSVSCIFDNFSNGADAVWRYADD